ncbi:MAG TPA: hypothetical protein VGQ39_09490 [Pyrinomonadaceae bacterium]|jgi:hypothetical protein|nr:hypothetical protein [Pyrinomonadaceae bacterium]
MINRRFLIAVALLVFAQTTFAQFGQNQSNNLLDLASRLAREAGDFAESNYRSYSSSFRSNRTDVEAVMLSEQFSGAAQVFSKMVNDRRRNQDLRDAYAFVQELARSVERNNLQRNSWYNIQRLMSDISRELESPGNDSGGYPDQGRGGQMTWKGRVDDDIRITIRGGRADVETIGGTPYYDAQPNFNNSLPSRRVNVSLKVKKGRGQVFLEQQPSRDNDYGVVVRIKDPKGGASDYEFELSW